MKPKTHKAAKRRFRVTATGKLRYNRPGRRHLLWHKTGNDKRRMHVTVVSETAQALKIVAAITV